MHKPVGNMLTTRVTVVREMIEHFSKEELEERLNYEAAYNLSNKISKSGKFKLENITQQEVEAYKKGLPITPHIIDDYFGQGIEYYEARVYVFTPRELKDYMDLIIQEALDREHQRILSSLMKKDDTADGTNPTTSDD